MSGPGNYSVRREWDIQVRAAQTPSAVDAVSQLEPSRELTVDREVISPSPPALGAGERRAARAFPASMFLAPLRALDKYLHGRIEQDATSRALPLLYYNDVALLGYGLGRSASINDRVQDAVYRIVDMQMSDGLVRVMGLLRPLPPSGCRPMRWTSCRAPATRRWRCPPASLQRGTDLAQPHGRQDIAQRPGAMPWYVVAKAGLADAGRVRYFQDTSGGKIIGGLAWTQLAACEPGRRARPRAARLRASPASASINATPVTITARACATVRRCWRWPRKRPAATACSPWRARSRERMVAKVEYTTTQEQALAGARGKGDVRRRRARLLGRRRAYRRRQRGPGRDQPRRRRRSRAACTSRTRANGRCGCRSRRAACRRSRSPPRSPGLDGASASY